MPNNFDTAAKEILGLSNSAIIPFLNANFAASHPIDARIIRTNTEYRLPSRPKKALPGSKTIIADEVFLVGDSSYYHLEVQLRRKTGMALRMFRYAAAEALGHPGEEDGVTTVSFPKSLVMYLEPAAGTPDCELLRVRFPDGSCYEYRTPVIKLTELSVRELGEALKREEDRGNMTEADGDKVQRMTEVLHEEVYGDYTEFEEDGMNSSSLSEDMRVIEKLHRELDEERRFREEEGQRLREDTARNILRLGLPVEQVAQATGLPPETVQMLAAQL
ncbi:MAG: hypothetical protein LBP93_08655 [Treponema sp.]|jgi:hypothetical protein|nr:hypothetical protein [Treponema sp.]